MITLKPFGRGASLRPFAHTRHRSRFGLMEQLRREFGGDPTTPERMDALDDIGPAARRALREVSDEVSA